MERDKGAKSGRIFESDTIAVASSATPAVITIVKHQKYLMIKIPRSSTEYLLPIDRNYGFQSANIVEHIHAQGYILFLNFQCLQPTVA